MQQNKNKFADFYHDCIYKVFNRFNGAKILTIDFQKPWWDIIWQQKYAIIFSVSFFTFQTQISKLNFYALLGYKLN
jgi:hypothetical protein